jgi:hypothetical protein
MKTVSWTVAVLTLAFLSGAGLGNAQQFEKNSASDIFGSNGPRVPVYGDTATKGTIQGRAEASTATHAARLEFLEEMCDKLGPQSTVCAELENFRSGTGSAGTQHLGFDPNGDSEAQSDSESDGSDTWGNQ